MIDGKYHNLILVLVIINFHLEVLGIFQLIKELDKSRCWCPNEVLDTIRKNKSSKQTIVFVETIDFMDVKTDEEAGTVSGAVLVMKRK